MLDTAGHSASPISVKAAQSLTAGWSTIVASIACRNACALSGFEPTELSYTPLRGFLLL